MKATIIATLTALLALLLAGCGNNKVKHDTTNDATAISAEGDSTIYGLACDGSNDTIVVFLRSPYTGTDPDTLNILEATRHHRVFGRPMIGDKLAIVRNPTDTTVADMLIVTEDLQAHWCYRVLPTLRERADMEDMRPSELPDSVRELLAIEHEYGFQLKAEDVAFPIGMGYRAKTTDEEGLVVYPELRRYFEWHLYNGQLVLQNVQTDSIGQRHIAISDTADILMLTADTLVLRFADHEQGYYRAAQEQ